MKLCYKISPEDYAWMLHSQNFSCAICGKHFDRETLAVDHCHETGKIRGLLCMKCNTHLASKDIPTLKSAIRYLNKTSV